MNNNDVASAFGSICEVGMHTMLEEKEREKEREWEYNQGSRAVEDGRNVVRW